MKGRSSIDKNLLIKEIYENVKSRQAEIKEVVENLKSYIEGKQDAVVLSPIIKDFLDIDIRNDGYLVKIFETMSKSEKEESNNEVFISEKEKMALLEIYSDLNKTQ